MQTLGTSEVAKSSEQILRCELCDYTTSRKCNYEKHLLTGKHIKRVIADRSPHNCTCGKVFTRSDSLFRHKKMCEVANIPTAKVAKVANSLPKVCQDEMT